MGAADVLEMKKWCRANISGTMKLSPELLAWCVDRGLKVRVGYEVLAYKTGSSRVYFIGHGSRTSDEAVQAWQREHPECDKAELYKRIWLIDPNCPQDDSLCPCNPVTDWEKIRDL